MLLVLALLLRHKEKYLKNFCLGTQQPFTIDDASRVNASQNEKKGESMLRLEGQSELTLCYEGAITTENTTIEQPRCQSASIKEYSG